MTRNLLSGNNVFTKNKVLLHCIVDNYETCKKVINILKKMW